MVIEQKHGINYSFNESINTFYCEYWILLLLFAHVGICRPISLTEKNVTKYFFCGGIVLCLFTYIYVFWAREFLRRTQNTVSIRRINLFLYSFGYLINNWNNPKTKTKPMNSLCNAKLIFASFQMKMKRLHKMFHLRSSFPWEIQHFLY